MVARQGGKRKEPYSYKSKDELATGHVVYF